MSKKYTPTIGIEIHTQLATDSKMFCACPSDDRGAAPNTNVCPVCLALPGALPVPNRRAVELAIKLGLGINANINELSRFDRKNYFYPDSPKGYQITQMDLPIVTDGKVEILIDGEFRTIRVNRAHLEEDAGKSIHPAGKAYSLVDLNRAGTPLLEIVSEPDMHSPLEARRYLQEIYNIATTLGVTRGDLQHGNFKFDLNVSVSDTEKLGTRTELKNLNSFRHAEKALTYEIQRQIELIEKGETVVQETRGYNDAKGITVSQRGKEEAHDYRYFPEPDIPPVVVTIKMIESARKDISVLPIEVRRELIELGLNVDEQDVLIGQVKTMEIFQAARSKVSDQKDTKRLVNWLVGDYQAWLAEHSEQESRLSGEALADLVNLITSNTISNAIAKDIFADVIAGGWPQEIVDKRGLAQLSDDSAIEQIIRDVISQNPQAKADYAAGKPQAIGFLMGQIMKASKGQANPSKAQALLATILKED
jgi:aspartyl-tRNA(Asn)/glutamyl-tRNA(Gln) amidotransferase subunit B